jgi:4'-phosphopantetheinyl transferase
MADAPLPGPCAPAWPSGPVRPHLEYGVVDVWSCDLDHCGELELAHLSADERTRASGIAREPARTRWARARVILRELLASYLDEAPGELELGVRAGGKPFLGRAGAPHFNLSHSGQLLLVAVSSTDPVGVDVELITLKERDVAAIASRALGPEQAARLAQIEDSAEQTREFLRVWVAHEARGKLTGVGLAARSEHGWVTELASGAQAVAALATASEPTAVRCWSWPPRD